MSSLLHFPDGRLEKEEAGQWLARLDRGLTRAEFEQLKAWLRDARRREALSRLARDWDSMSVVEELSELFPLRESEDFSPRLLGRVAAVLVIAGASAVFWLQLRPHTREEPALAVSAPPQHAVPAPAPAPAPPFAAEYSTAVGERRTVELPDHTTIRLNTNTELRVDYSATVRLLRMTRGEALFEVAKDPSRVFVVRAGGYDFKAVGTAFDIRANAPGGLRLTVTEGRVRVHRGASTSVPRTTSADALPDASPPVFDDATDMVIDANKAVSIAELSERIDVLTPEQVAAATAWQRGVIIFKAAPLEEVVSELARYSTTRFVMAEQKLGRIPVSGYFEIGDIDSLAAALEQNVGIKVTKHSGYVLLSAAPPPQ